MGLVREEKPSKIVNWETWPLFRFWVLEKKILLLSLRETLSFSNRWLITFICLLRSASIRTYLTVCIRINDTNLLDIARSLFYCCSVAKHHISFTCCNLVLMAVSTTMKPVFKSKFIISLLVVQDFFILIYNLNA